jgi:transposase-like protein/ribosomal protein L37AE/L43A
MKTFKNILEFQKEFSSEEKCRGYLEQQRWNGTPACPFCGSLNVCRFTNGKIFKCREKQCRQKFSVLVGSVYQNTKIPLTKWFLATYILSVHSKGISSLQLANFIGVTVKTAWHLNHRIREMLTDKSPELLDGIVELDETLIGGSLSNIHASKKERLKLKREDNKTMVFGALQRNGKLRTKVIPNVTKENLTEAVESFVAPDSIMVTDENIGYNKVGLKYKHRKVNHRNKEYVRKEDILIHTNNIEGYWNILKKQIDGIHHSVSPKHLQRYCNESTFRFNNRELFQDERFAAALANSRGSLTLKQLTGKK